MVQCSNSMGVGETKEEGLKLKGSHCASIAGLAGVTTLHGLNTTIWNGILAPIVEKQFKLQGACVCTYAGAC